MVGAAGLPHCLALVAILVFWWQRGRETLEPSSKHAATGISSQQVNDDGEIAQSLQRFICRKGMLEDELKEKMKFSSKK